VQNRCISPLKQEKQKVQPYLGAISETVPKQPIPCVSLGHPSKDSS